MPPFEFEDLELGKQQIRVLHLQPGDFHDPISAILSVACLADNPRYEALSYVWGNPNVCLDIYLDGCTLSVTLNLWAALRRRMFQAVLPSKPPIGADDERPSQKHPRGKGTLGRCSLH